MTHSHGENTLSLKPAPKQDQMFNVLTAQVHFNQGDKP